MVRSALIALGAAGVNYATRGVQPIDDVPDGGDVDIMVSSTDLRLTDRVLRSRGFDRFRAPGHPEHRFYLAFRNGRWLKVDVNIVPPDWPLEPSIQADGIPVSSRQPPYRVVHGRGGVGSIARAASRRRPASWRRVGPVIAFLGPDGSGKGTLIAGLRRRVPVAVTVLYLGRGGRGVTRRQRPNMVDWPPADSTRAPVPSSFVGRGPSVGREVAFVLVKAIRIWAKLLRGYLAAWRGHIVLCDRHPIEVLAIRPERARAAAALERFVATWVTLSPDVIVLLDAPSRTLYERKAEHSITTLDRWRRSYLEVFGSKAVVVSTTGSVEQSITRTSEVVWEALRKRRHW